MDPSIMSYPAPAFPQATFPLLSPALNDTVPPAPAQSPSNSSGKLYRRSRSGCFTCRLRRKKCDETRPTCKSCSNLALTCEYKQPSWWKSAEMRQSRKNEIKEKIRETKVMEKQRNLQEQINRLLPPSTYQFDFSRPPAYANLSHLPSPSMLTTYPSQSASGLTEPNAATQPTASWQAMPPTPFSAPLAQPYPYATSFNLPTSEGLQGSYELSTPSQQPQPQQPPSQQPQTRQPPGQQAPSNIASREDHQKRAEKPLSTYLKGTRDLDAREKTLLNHFVDNVLRLIFPILDIHQQGPVRACEILNSLETNKSYYHCCLSVSAIHLKSNLGVRSERIDRDIMQHRYRAVSHLCRSLNSDQGHDTILDATLAMIFFHCSVGAPDDHLPDIPWNEHFTAVTNLVNKLGLIEQMPYTPLPFNISLTTWIDILGATILGKSPYFAHTYRTKHLNGVSSNLRELMGCDDRIMYLISEIACLDSLKSEGQVDDFAVCHHISALSTQLEHAQPPDLALENSSSASGLIDPECLTKNMTAIFRVAAQIYLYSLVPGFDPSQTRITNLVTSVAEILRLIPTGPYGFDRSLVWPLMITGAFSTASSSFRGILAQRASALGDSGDFGSFGRMYCLLQEVWRLSDDSVEANSSDPTVFSSSPPVQHSSQAALPTPGTQPGVQPVKRQKVHWRDVMRNNGWRYLLI